MEYRNSVLITVLCHDYSAHEHHFGFQDMAPSKAVHLALVDVPCVGNFTVSTTVLETRFQPLKGTS